MCVYMCSCIYMFSQSCWPWLWGVCATLCNAESSFPWSNLKSIEFHQVIPLAVLFIIVVICIHPGHSFESWQEISFMLVKRQIADATDRAAHRELARILSLSSSQNKLERVLVFSVSGCGQMLPLVVCRQMSSFPVGKTSRGWNQTKQRSKTFTEKVHLKMHGTKGLI